MLGAAAGAVSAVSEATAVGWGRPLPRATFSQKRCTRLSTGVCLDSQVLCGEVYVLLAATVPKCSLSRLVSRDEQTEKILFRSTMTTGLPASADRLSSGHRASEEGINRG